MATPDQVLDALRQVPYPGFSRDIVSFGIVRDVQVGSLPLPHAVVPTLLRRVRRGPAAPDLADDALEVPIPDYIGDVRVARGRITLYRRS